MDLLVIAGGLRMLESWVQFPTTPGPGEERGKQKVLAGHVLARGPTSKTVLGILGSVSLVFVIETALL